MVFKRLRHRLHRHRRPAFSAGEPISTFSAAMMEDNLFTAESLISRWSSSSSSSTTSLFASDDAGLFLRSVADLHHAILFFSSSSSASSLPRAHSLMSAAIRLLGSELHHLLTHTPTAVSRSSSTSSSNSSGFSTEDDILSTTASIVANQRATAASADDLRAIANTMAAAGYGATCTRIYTLARRSVIDESLYRLGFELDRLTPSQLQKLDWVVLDLKIRSWLAAAPVAVNTLFAGERELCDLVFAEPGAAQASFDGIAAASAAGLFAFPESVARIKRSPEKLFRMLDLYNTVSGLWPDVESMFSSSATAAGAVRSQTLASLLKLADSARATLALFESAIDKDATATAVAGGAVHPLTRYATNYIIFLADYAPAIADIYDGFPFDSPSSLLDFLLDAPTPEAAPPDEGSPRGGSAAPRIAWLVLSLLCKIDGMAEAYRPEVALSYLFLANNLQYVLARVGDAGELSRLLGEGWALRYGAKVRQYTASYTRMAWAGVAATVPAPEAAAEMGPTEAWERMGGFNSAFEAARRAQAGWVVVDKVLREEVRASVASMIVPAYRVFYDRSMAVMWSAAGEAVVRFSPEDVEYNLSDLLGS